MSRNTTVRRAVAGAVLLASGFAIGAGEADAQEAAAGAQGSVACGQEIYVVRPGDSLSQIAQRAYSSFNYQVIFDANGDVLTDPAVLVVGQQLFIPCLDGRGPASKAEALGSVPAEATGEAASDPVVRKAVLVEPAPAAETDLAAGTALAAAPSATDATPALDRPVRFLTGSDFAPFTGRDLPEGGLLTDIVNRAMQRADALRPYAISWENDWDLHLSTLLPEGEHDLGFPWPRPDCGAAGLAQEMRQRCTDYDFSRPLYEAAMGYYMAADAPEVAAREHSALIGKRICRPAGHFTFDLEEAGLVEPDVTMARPGTAADCFRMLAEGQVDVVAVESRVAEREIGAMAMRGKVADAPELSSIETLHAVAPRSNPYGRAYLELLDRGLAQLREEGVMAELTSRHLAEYAKGL